MSAGTLLETGLIPAAEKTGALAAQHADEADRRGRLPHEVVDAVRDAGFARHFVGSRWGGTEGTFEEVTNAVVAVGEHCSATAWCASLSAYSARFASHLPVRGQEALWGESPDVVIATGLVPAGRADPVDDGWRLSGRWSYVSGAAEADWVLLCAAVPAAASKPAFRFFALPWGVFSVDEDWDSVGMRATGSHSVLVEDTFVPGHLTFDRADIMAGRSAASEAGCHNVPFQAVGSLTFVGPVVGAGRGALNACAAGITGRRRNAVNEIRLARASGRIDAAQELVLQNARMIDGRRFTADLLARNERNSACATELTQEAVELLVRAAGTGGLGQSHPLQRFWRDVTSATSHIALQYDTAAAKNYAAVLLGPAE